MGILIVRMSLSCTTCNYLVEATGSLHKLGFQHATRGTAAKLGRLWSFGLRDLFKKYSFTRTPTPPHETLFLLLFPPSLGLFFICLHYTKYCNSLSTTKPTCFGPFAVRGHCTAQNGPTCFESRKWAKIGKIGKND